MKKLLERIIGPIIGGVLVIGGTAYYVSQDDIVDQYKQNTGEEINVDDMNFVDTEGVIQNLNDILEDLGEFDITKADCDEMGDDRYNSFDEGEKQYSCYDAVNILSDLKTSYNNALKCEQSILNGELNGDLEKSDIEYCVTSWQSVRDADTHLCDLEGWDDGCNDDIKGDERNIAYYQSYLKQL